MNGLPSEAGTPSKVHVMWFDCGHVSARRADEFFQLSCTCARTVFGAVLPRFMPFHTASKMWQPMSPLQPVPKSCHERQIIGW